MLPIEWASLGLLLALFIHWIFVHYDRLQRTYERFWRTNDAQTPRSPVQSGAPEDHSRARELAMLAVFALRALGWARRWAFRYAVRIDGLAKANDAYGLDRLRRATNWATAAGAIAICEGDNLVREGRENRW
jgi:hypothetical protein